MSTPRAPDPAKLVVGLFLRDRSLLGAAAAELTERFGPVDTVSAWLPFDYTDYYEREMGAPLFRRVFSFAALVAQGDLAGIKHATNAIETRFAAAGRRRLNIDPGYLLPARFVLATGKDYSHRIYIGGHMYADLTLVYKKGGFCSLPWTYPDYADERMLAYLERVRNRYLDDLKRTVPAAAPPR